MPDFKSNESMIQSGIASEYFLLAFLEPRTAYKLGQIVQNTTGKPDSSMITPHIDALKKSGYLFGEKGKKLSPNLAKLISEINVILNQKQSPLDKNESDFLQSMLQERTFFKIVTNEITRDIQGQPFRTHNIDALKIISDKIGLVASMFLLMKIFNPNTDNQDDSTEIDKFHSVWDENTPTLDGLLSWFSGEIISSKKKPIHIPKNIELLAHKNKVNMEEFEKIKQNLEQDATKTRDMLQQMIKNKQEIPPIKSLSELTLFTFKTFPTSKAFMMAPEDLLFKIAKLWSNYDGVAMALSFAQNLKTNT